MTAAAELSQQLLTGPGVRVVLVAETEAAGPDDPVGLTDVVAVHADSDPVDPDDGDPPELGWYAVQELGDLLR